MKKNKNSVDADPVTGSVLVAICQDPGNSPYKILEQALTAGGFWRCLTRRRNALKNPASAFKIVIKPDMQFFDIKAPTGTDPLLVEHMVGLLHAKGYPDVTVADGIGSAELWLENRDVVVLADLAGYRFRTDNGKRYNVVNLSEDLVEGGFPMGSLLEGSSLGKTWVEADFRISMAKNKTSQEYGYSLGLQNILGVLPLRDKEYHYYHQFEPGDICAELLQQTPVHFSIIDAIVSNHGSNGSGRSNPLATGTVIASESIILSDFIGAMKMSLDPYISPINSGVMKIHGLPVKYKITGDLSPYENWINVPLLLLDSVRRRNNSLTMHQVTRAWFQDVNKEIFPFKNYLDEKVNDSITKLVREIDTHPLGLISAAFLNYLVAALQRAVEVFHVMYEKERVGRRITSLGIDLSKYNADDFSAIVSYIEPLAGVLQKTQPDPNGLRWRYLDKSVIFQYKRILPVEFNKFVSRVDISAAVRMMNDNIGGAASIIKKDRSGRIIQQAERNIYLPQPNWMAMFGGDVIDVGKLEYVRYLKNRHQIFWRTVNSHNNSARYDDGMVTFESSPKHGTLINIVARQEFILPLFWQVFNIDYLPKVKDALVSDSYSTYFSRTMANYEAAFEGRNVSTGQEWDKRAGEADGTGAHMPLEKLVDTALKLFEVAQPLIRAFRESAGNKQENAQDDENPANTAGWEVAKRILETLGGEAQTFFSDLSDAVKKDVSANWNIPENN